MAAVRLLRPPLLFFFLLFLLFTTPTSSQVSDADALLNLKKSFTNAASLSSWSADSKSGPCTPKKPWVGVICENGIVQRLRLGKMGLSGTFDVQALVGMKGLHSIGLDGNDFMGSIPEFNLLHGLRAIYLSGNKFSGTIPSDYFTNMASLKKVWLANNGFTGEIPNSLSNLQHLTDLHLENNQFSGKIPPLQQSTLVSFNVSNNKLEGEISSSFEKFDGSSFAGNDGLCGEKVGKNCSNSSFALYGLSFVIIVLVVATFVVVRRKKVNFNMLAKDNYAEPKQDYMSSDSKHKDLESGWKRTDSSQTAASHQSKGSNHGRVSHRSKGSQSGRSNAMGDLEVVNDERGIFGLQDLMKAAAEVLGNGGLGSAYKAVMANGIAVVVKRMRDMNMLSKDEFGDEMRKLGSLRHRNILTPLAYHYRTEEKLIVSEYIPKGSLLYVLHGDKGQHHNDLDWPARLKVVKGIARGLDFLHSELSSYEIPHGNLKSNNVFLSCEYEPLLSDYGYSQFLSPTQAAQTLFAYKAPESILYQQVSPKCDVYSLGILILEILTGKFPSQYLNNGKGGTDVVQWVASAISEKREAELFDPEIADSKGSIGEMEKLLHIGAACVEQDPALRLSIKEVIEKIEEIQVSGNQGIHLAVPTLRDGYANVSLSSRSHTSNVLEGYGELSGRRGSQESFGERRNGESFVFDIS